MTESPALPEADPAPPSTLKAWFEALPQLALAGLFLFTWFRPMAIEGKMVSYLVLTMLLEFIVIHSTAFCGVVVYSDTSRGKKVKLLAGLTLLYGIFVVGFALGFASLWPLLAFGILTANRAFAIFSTRLPSEQRQQFIARSWGMGAVCYLLAVFISTPLPMPRFGITEAVVEAQGFTVGGLWTEEPHHAIAMGVIYFSLMALWQIRGPGSIHREILRKRESIRRAKEEAAAERNELEEK